MGRVWEGVGDWGKYVRVVVKVVYMWYMIISLIYWVMVVV